MRALLREIESVSRADERECLERQRQLHQQAAAVRNNDASRAEPVFH
jgi:hypothetical protein